MVVQGLNSVIVICLTVVAVKFDQFKIVETEKIPI